MSGTPAAAAPSKGVAMASKLSAVVIAVLFIILPMMKVVGTWPFASAPNASVPGFTNPLPGVTGGGSGGTTDGSTPSPSQSAPVDPRVKYFNLAAGTSNGTKLQGEGYEPAAVYELAPDAGVLGSNGQVSTWLNGFTGRTGETAYVLLRNRDYASGLVAKPREDIKPDRVIMVNSGTASDGDLVAYAQDFADGRGTACYLDKGNEFDLSNPSNWYEINSLSQVRGSSLGGSAITLKHADLPLIPSGEEITCMTYRPVDEELQSIN